MQPGHDKELQTPHLLSRAELAEQVRRYVAAFNLNVITSAKIQSTLYDQAAKRWTIKFQTPAGERTAFSKHLVQATGIGSQKLYLPPMADSHLYKGISIHSAGYKNATQLREQGVKVSYISSIPQPDGPNSCLNPFVLTTLRPFSSSAPPTPPSTSSKTATPPASKPP